MSNLKRMKEIIISLALMIQLSKEQSQIDESNLGTRFGTGEYGTPSFLHWYDDFSSPQFELCTPGQQYSPTVIAFWHKFNGVINVGSSPSTFPPNILESPADLFFEFGDTSSCLQWDNSGDWLFSYYEVTDLCTTYPSPNIVYLRQPISGAVVCSGSPPTSLELIGYSGVSGANPKTFNLNSNMVVRRLITTQKSVPGTFGIEALIYFLGQPKVVERMFWSIYSTNIEQGLVFESGNKGNIIRRMMPYGIKLAPDSGDYFYVPFSALDLNLFNQVPSWSFFSLFYFRINSLFQQSLSGQQILLKTILNVKSSAPITPPAPLPNDFEQQYTMKMLISFGLNGDATYVIDLVSESSGFSSKTYTVSFSAPIENQLMFSSNVDFYIKFPITIQLALLNSGSIMLKVGIDGDLSPKFTDGAIFGIESSNYGSPNVYFGLYYSYEFITPTPDLETVRKGISIYLQKSIITNGGYFEKQGIFHIPDCMHYMGVQYFSTCVECGINRRIDSDTNIGNGVYPICQTCSTFNADFINCELCTETGHCIKPMNDWQYYYNPFIPASSLMIKLNKQGNPVTFQDMENDNYIENCNGDINYNPYLYGEEGKVGCYPCEVSSCFCNDFQTEFSNIGTGKKACSCNTPGCKIFFYFFIYRWPLYRKG